MGRTIEEIKVVDVEKRKIPSKHYVSNFVQIIQLIGTCPCFCESFFSQIDMI